MKALPDGITVYMECEHYGLDVNEPMTVTVEPLYRITFWGTHQRFKMYWDLIWYDTDTPYSWRIWPAPPTPEDIERAKRGEHKRSR